MLEDLDRLRILEDVRGKISSEQESIKGFRAKIEDSQRVIENLTRLEAYLSQSDNPSSISPPVRNLGVATQPCLPLTTWPQITPDDIEKAAANLILTLKHPVQALHVARAIVEGYNGDDDDRALEKRIYSLLYSRKQRFTKVGRGHWDLLERQSRLAGIANDLLTMNDPMLTVEAKEKPHDGE
ncbi:hypothetical protein [Limnoglobus roseus]|uniref:Uncharacterized protein n=1 Tax=Limnoglobus roseus TaxID=2598579 RepID=A0A5C1A4H8_9BACT|nr:hypothetical protein [Limnoglobus roseus]QEL14011.1 hypothetical protein PX52LOC_00873 [Limnoglobus roseus]